MDREVRTVDLTASSQMAIFWNILHFLTARYGNNPMGHTLVTLSMIFLNERGMPPTMTNLCEATGLPKASVSRYVKSQIRDGYVEEQVDPGDGRRRLLAQTPKGKAEWRWQLQKLKEVFDKISALDERLRREGDSRDAAEILRLMKEVTRNSPDRAS